MIVNFKPIFDFVEEKENAKKLIIAIEGGSASGKTSLAKLLQEKYDATVFHTDDFFLRPEQRTKERLNEVGGNMDRERFLDEVLLPLCSGETVKYRPFDCHTMSLCNEISVTPKKLVIIEGAYSMHPNLIGYYDYSVFLDIDKDFQRDRILKRNTPALAQRFFDEWIPLEDRYFSEMKIKEKCDLIIKID